MEIQYSKGWEDIPEDEPDEVDRQMLSEIEKNPECHEFVRAEDIDWEN